MKHERCRQTGIQMQEGLATPTLGLSPSCSRPPLFWTGPRGFRWDNLREKATRSLLNESPAPGPGPATQKSCPTCVSCLNTWTDKLQAPRMARFTIAPVRCFHTA